MSDRDSPGTQPPFKTLPCGVDIEETCRLAIPFIEEEVDACLIKDRDDAADADFFLWMSKATLAEKVRALLPEYFDNEEKELDEFNTALRGAWGCVIDLSDAVESGDLSVMVEHAKVWQEGRSPTDHPTTQVHFLMQVMFEHVCGWRRGFCDSE